MVVRLRYTAAVRLLVAYCCFTVTCLCACAGVSRANPDAATHPLEARESNQPFCAPHGPEICLDGLDNNCNGVFEEGCGVAQGTVQFFVAWKRSEVDVDLVVVDPSGATAELGAISKGGLLKERECPGKSEAVCKVGPYENVVLVASREPMAGRYRVQVSVEPAPAEPVSVVLAGRLGSQLVREQFALDYVVAQRTFAWSLSGVE